MFVSWQESLRMGYQYRNRLRISPKSTKLSPEITTRYRFQPYDQFLHESLSDPHKVRHSGTTTYLELTDGDLRGAQAYSRHANLNTLKFYDDNRKQLQKKASAKLAETIAWNHTTAESSD